jgi:hypothetical protein
MKKTDRDEDDEMRPEYDLDALGPGIRGKHYARLMARSNVVRIAPDVHDAFPNERAVNAALRGLIRKRTKAPPKSGRGGRRAAR